jgi:hypothetical protein
MKPLLRESYFGGNKTVLSYEYIFIGGMDELRNKFIKILNFGLVNTNYRALFLNYSKKYQQITCMLRLRDFLLRSFKMLYKPIMISTFFGDII